MGLLDDKLRMIINVPGKGFPAVCLILMTSAYILAGGSVAAQISSPDSNTPLEENSRPRTVIGPDPIDEPAVVQAEEPLHVPLTEIIGTSPAALEHIPGSGRVVTQESLSQNRRLSINEALREVPGVNVRDEEGLGIRPNIGIRGLDPSRSRKIHIMEDGVPIMLMPYGDPSAYYFPPVFRFDRIEVLKGSGQLLYGPQTIGGVMNLITRMPPRTPQGNVELRGGNLNYFNTHFDYGGTWGKSGYLADYTHFQSDSPRFTNNRVKVDDFTFKTVQELSDRTTILAKFNYYREDSGVGYQGFTEADWALRGRDRKTLFTNDNFDFREGRIRRTDPWQDFRDACLPEGFARCRKLVKLLIVHILDAKARSDCEFICDKESILKKQGIRCSFANVVFSKTRRCGRGRKTR